YADQWLYTDRIGAEENIALAVGRNYCINLAQKSKFIEFFLVGRAEHDFWKGNFKAIFRQFISCGHKYIFGGIVERISPGIVCRSKIASHGRKSPVFMAVSCCEIYPKTPAFRKIADKAMNHFYISTYG